MAIQIRRGKRVRPVRCVLYGVEGIGKSTLAAQSPDPVFIDLEQGTDTMDVARVDAPVTSWVQLLGTIHELCMGGGFRTLVIDTADAAEKLCETHTIASGGSNIHGIEDFGYGRGYVYMKDNYAELLRACDRAMAMGYNVFITSHATRKKIEMPEQTGSYDHWEMKLSKHIAPLVKEWCDMLLFMNYRTTIITTEEKTKKATGGERVIYTEHNACWDAKNRYGLQPMAPAKWEYIQVAFSAEPALSIMDTVLQKVAVAGITVESLQAAVETRNPNMVGMPLNDYTDDFIVNYVLKYFDRLVDIAREFKREA